MGFVPPPNYFEGPEAFDKWVKEREKFRRFVGYSFAILIVGVMFFGIILLIKG